jgi:hypothetical protein
MINSGIDKGKFKQSLLDFTTQRTSKHLLPEQVKFTTENAKIFPVKIIYKKSELGKILKEL